MTFHIDMAIWDAAPAQEICVCGLGARTAVGMSVAASAAAVRGGVSGLSLHPVFKDRANEPISFAADPMLAPDVPLAQRMWTMLLSVIEEASLQASPPASPSLQIDACWLSLPEPRAGLEPHLDQWLGQKLADDLRLPVPSVRVLSQGHAGGLMALQAAALALSRREVNVALVVGTDSYHDRQTLHSLDLRRRLMSAENRGGFPPGEAAGACILMRSDTAAQYGLPVLARLRAAATAMEPHSIKASTPCLGEGLSAVLTCVTRGLDGAGELVSDSYCDINGERYRNEEFVYALLRTQRAFVDAKDYTCPADCWGDVGASSGLLYLALAVVAQKRGYAKGRHTLLWAGSDSGCRSALAMTSTAGGRA